MARSGPLKEIANILSRAPLTTYREIRRNYDRDEEISKLNGYHRAIARGNYEDCGASQAA
jgi:IS30 family transposase